MAVTLPVDWTPERKAAFKLVAQNQRVMMMTLIADAIEKEHGAEIDKAERILKFFASSDAEKQQTVPAHNIAAIGGD